MLDENETAVSPPANGAFVASWFGSRIATWPATAAIRVRD